jgi:hypothetical protein
MFNHIDQALTIGTQYDYSKWHADISGVTEGAKKPSNEPSL